jgi:hypothetical protein
MDEKGFLIGVLGRTRRIFTREAYKKGLLKGAGQDGNREWITLIGSICMDGTTLPPGLIYKADLGDLQDTWLVAFDPKEHNCYFTSSSTGWTNEKLGLSWVKDLFDPATRRKSRFGLEYRLLLVDGHNSHVNMKFLDWCDEQKILVAVYPPHSTHRLQPLDVSLFSPLGLAYTQELNQWIYRTGGFSRVTKRNFFELFWPSFGRAFTTENVLSGWEKTGLQPWNPELVLKQVRKNERPSSSGTSSGGSILSHPDWREVERMVKKGMGQEITEGGRKLVRTIDYQNTKIFVLEAKVASLQESLAIEKSRVRRGKGLKLPKPADGEPKAQFYSPNKIGEAKRRRQEEELEKNAAQAQKEEDKLRRIEAKKEKQILTDQRKAEREKQRLQREEEKRKKDQLRKEEAEQKAVDKQLTADVKKVKNYLKVSRARTKKQLEERDAVIKAVEEEGVEIRSSRFGRQIKPRKQFN